jgi:hypothetical protein
MVLLDLEFPILTRSFGDVRLEAVKAASEKEFYFYGFKLQGKNSGIKMAQRVSSRTELTSYCECYFRKMKNAESTLYSSRRPRRS